LILSVGLSFIIFNKSKVFKGSLVAQVESTARTSIKLSCSALLTGNNWRHPLPLQTELYFGEPRRTISWGINCMIRAI